MTSVADPVDAAGGGFRDPPHRNRASAVQRTVDRITNRLWSSPVRTFPELWSAQREAFVRGRLLVRIFYLLSVMWVVSGMNAWEVTSARRR